MIKFRFIADDYGESPATNTAIISVCSAGTVKSATVLAAKNCLYSRDHLSNSLDVSWGVHLYLTEYAPLTDGLRLCSRQYQAPIKKNILIGLATGRLSRQKISLEFEAQIIRLLEYGFPVEFIDTHQNVHTIPAVYSVIKSLAEKYHLSENIRPIKQLNFNLKHNLKQLLSGVCSMCLGLPVDKYVLVGCPGYCTGDLDLDRTLALWEATLIGITRRGGVEELYVPCHPGVSPAESILYSSKEFSDLLKRYTVKII